MIEENELGFCLISLKAHRKRIQQQWQFLGDCVINTINVMKICLLRKKDSFAFVYDAFAGKDYNKNKEMLGI